MGGLAKVTLAEKLAMFDSHWDPHVVAGYNGNDVMEPATAEAIAEWEPRFAVQRVQATEAGPGRVTLSLTGTYQPNGQPLTLDGLVIA